MLIELGKENGVDRRNIGVHRYEVFGEVPIDEIAEAGIERHAFVQRGAHAEHHAADRLRAGRLRIQDPAGSEYAQHAP